MPSSFKELFDYSISFERDTDDHISSALRKCADTGRSVEVHYLSKNTIYETRDGAEYLLTHFALTASSRLLGHIDTRSRFSKILLFRDA